MGKSSPEDDKAKLLLMKFNLRVFCSASDVFFEIFFYFLFLFLFFFYLFIRFYAFFIFFLLFLYSYMIMIFSFFLCLFIRLGSFSIFFSLLSLFIHTYRPISFLFFYFALCLSILPLFPVFYVYS